MNEVFNRIYNYVYAHFFSICKAIDYFALCIFSIYAVEHFVIGSVSRAVADCTTICWILIAHSRARIANDYMWQCDNMQSTLDDFMMICNRLKEDNHKLKAKKKDNDNSKS